MHKVDENFCDVDKNEVTKNKKGKLNRRKDGKKLENREEIIDFPKNGHDKKTSYQDAIFE